MSADQHALADTNLNYVAKTLNDTAGLTRTVDQAANDNARLQIVTLLAIGQALLSIADAIRESKESAMNDDD